MKSKILFLVLILVLSAVFTGCVKVPDGPLPRSMKGYELYSWQEDGKWHFTLITGTNRNKTLEEIVSTQDAPPEDGWVNLHVTGTDRIKEVLSRLPTGEFVSWGEGRFTVGEAVSVTLELPPDDIVDEIKGYALKRGLDFSVLKTDIDMYESNVPRETGRFTPKVL